MDYQTLRVEIKNGVGIVWMHRPKLKNTLDETMVAEMAAAMRVLDDEPSVRAVVLAATGESFCVGADLNWMARMADGPPARNRADALAFATLLHTIDTLKKPTIARVQGQALAGGIGLVAACDMAVVSYDAEFCLSEVRLGLIPATIAPYVVRAMGERMARRYFLSAEPFTAAEAYRIGLVSDIAPPEELDATINELLGHLIQGGPGAQAMAKEWIRSVAGAPITDGLVKTSAERLAAARASAEGREGIRAFLAKRRPPWLGQTKETTAKKGAPAKAKRTK